MKKILVIRYGTIGDSIFASAFYRELRRAMPNTRIDILVDKVAEGVMKNCPYINRIFFIDGKYKNLFGYINLFKKYDTVFFLKNDSFFTKVAFLAGVKNRIGFNVKRNKFLTLKSPYNEDRHEIDCYLDLLRILNIPVKNSQTELWLSDINNEKVKNILCEVKNTKVLIQAYSRFPQKNWLDEYWVKIVKFLSNNCNAQVFYAGGQKDNYDNITKNLKNCVSITPIDMCGKLSIEETMSLINGMDLVIGIDSGLIHMAAALDIPSILLHGPTSLTRWQPRSENCTVLSRKFSCSPCCLQTGSIKYCKNKIPECMEFLTPDIVINAIKNKLITKTH